MKSGIHPEFKEIKVTCSSCGNKFKVGSSSPKDLTIEVCDHCHPFYSGQQKIIEKRGRVEKYRQRYETPRVVETTPHEVSEEPKKKLKKTASKKTSTKSKTKSEPSAIKKK